MLIWKQRTGVLKEEFYQLPPLLHCLDAVDEAPLPQLPLLLSPELEAPPLLTPILEAAAATVNTSSQRSGHNTIAVSDAATSTTSSAPNVGDTTNATSSGHSQPTATSSGHSQPSINTGHNLDTHDAASLPVPAILNDNISVYISSEDDSSIFTISTKTSNNQGKSNPIQRPTGGAAKNDSQSSPRRFAAATSLVNLTVGCRETEGNEDNVLPAIDKAIDEMFPQLRNTLADGIEVVEFAMITSQKKSQLKDSMTMMNSFKMTRIKTFCFWTLMGRYSHPLRHQVERCSF